MKYRITVADMACDDPEDPLIYGSEHVAIVNSLTDVPQAIIDYHMSGRCFKQSTCGHAYEAHETPPPHDVPPVPSLMDPYVMTDNLLPADLDYLAWWLDLQNRHGVLCYYGVCPEGSTYGEELYAIRTMPE